MTPYITKAERDAIRAVIDTPEKWTKGRAASDSSGEACDYWGPDATCFCLLGAVAKVHGEEEVYDRIKLVLSEKLGTDDVVGWNDERCRTHPEVLALLDGLPVVEEVAT